MGPLGRGASSILANIGQFLGLFTLNWNVNKLFEISKMSQEANMGVYGKVFWGGESIFEVKLVEFCSHNDISFFE